MGTALARLSEVIPCESFLVLSPNVQPLLVVRGNGLLRVD